MALNFANNNSLSSITALPSGISGGGLNLISTQTASSSANLSFTSGIDSTYKEYIFKFYNIHPSAAAVFTFNGSTDGGSNYNITKTTTHFRAYHNEADTDTSLTYDEGSDLAQSTNYQNLGHAIKTDNDASGAGYLHIFEPSSTTFVKNFIAQFTVHQNSDYNMNSYIAGYFNNTSAINAIDFKMSSGTFDGVIKLYGVS